MGTLITHNCQGAWPGGSGQGGAGTVQVANAQLQIGHAHRLPTLDLMVANCLMQTNDIENVAAALAADVATWQAAQCGSIIIISGTVSSATNMAESAAAARSLKVPQITHANWLCCGARLQRCFSSVFSLHTPVSSLLSSPSTLPSRSLPRHAYAYQSIVWPANWSAGGAGRRGGGQRFGH